VPCNYGARHLVGEPFDRSARYHGFRGILTLGMSGEALKGHLDLLLLACVERDALHGYALIQELRRRSNGNFDLPEGTVYPALHRLERSGYLKSRWALVGGRRRRVYSLTRDGRGALERQTSAWRQFSDSVNVVIERA
jgi:PadR family transcriptional regulator PadR